MSQKGEMGTVPLQEGYLENERTVDVAHVSSLTQDWGIANDQMFPAYVKAE